MLARSDLTFTAAIKRTSNVDLHENNFASNVLYLIGKYVLRIFIEGQQ